MALEKTMKLVQRVTENVSLMSMRFEVNDMHLKEHLLEDVSKFVE